MTTKSAGRGPSEASDRPTPPPGFDFLALQVRDVDAAAAFYRDVVGLPPAPDSPAGARLFDTRPIAFAVREPLVDLDAVPQLGHGVAMWLGVDDVDALRGRLEEHGASIVAGPAPSPFGTVLVFRDPEGYVVTAHQRGAEPT
jgi:predicted enzyme related to lactoylglutathione lyase